MSDYSSHSSSSSDSEEDLFDVCLPTQYPYRPPRVDAPENTSNCKFQVNPDRMPTLQASLGAYVVRGFANVSDSIVWEPHAVKAEDLATFLLYARRVQTALTMSQLLNLVKKCEYDLQGARLALLKPLIHTDSNSDTTSPLSSSSPTYIETDAELHREVRAVLDRFYQHQHIKDFAADDKWIEPSTATRIVEQVTTTNARVVEDTWKSLAKAAEESIKAATDALIMKGAGEDSQPPNTKKSAPPSASKSKKKKVTSNEEADEKSEGEMEDKDPSTAAASATPIPPAKDDVDQMMSDTNEADDKEKKPSADGEAENEEDNDECEEESSSAEEELVADDSFLYPWLQTPGVPTRIPAPALIDVLKLRDIIQIVSDAAAVGESSKDKDTAGDKSPHFSSALPSVRSALHTVSSQHLAVLQQLLSAKNDWLDRVRPILNGIGRSKDNYTLEQLLELLRDLEREAPSIDSRERRKCIALVNKVQEWRVTAHVAFKLASKNRQLDEAGLLQYAPIILKKKNNNAQSAAANKEALTNLNANNPVPFTIHSLIRLVKECERSCGCIGSEESVFLRSVHDFIWNFVRQIETLLECRLEKDTDKETEEEEEDEEATSPVPAPKKRGRPPTVKDESKSDEDMEGSSSEESEVLQPRVSARNHAVLARIEAAEAAAAKSAAASNKDNNQPIDQPNTITTNDYARESGTLPAKLSLAHARLLLERFHTRYAFLFQVPQSVTLANEIKRCEKWLEDTNAVLKRQRSETETVDEWVSLLQSLLDGGEKLPIQLESHLIDPLCKGLQVRLWAARVDQAFQNDTTAPPSTDASKKKRGPSLSIISQLLEEAGRISVNATNPRLVKLQQVLSSAQSHIEEAQALLNPRSSKSPIETWLKLLDRIRQLPIQLDEEARIERLIHNTYEWHKKANGMLGREVDDKGQPIPSTNPDEPTVPHSISYQEVEALLHKAGGKSIALILAENCAAYAELDSYLKVGQSWCQEVSECFKHLSHSSASKKAATRKSTPAPTAEAQAALAAHQHMDRYATMERLKMLLGLYTHRDSEIQSDQEEEEEEEEEEEGGEEKSEKQKTEKAEKKAEKEAEKEEKKDAEMLDSNKSPSPAVPVSLPTTDPTNWSWLTRYSLSNETFEKLLPCLELRMADSLSDRLSLVGECLAMAWNALKGPMTCSVQDLSKLVHQLQQSGELETAEPLKSLQARLKSAIAWRTAVRKALPAVYLMDLKRKLARKKVRNHSTNLNMLTSANAVRGSRRTRKKSSTPSTSKKSDIDAAIDAEDEAESDGEGGDAVASLDTFNFSDEDDNVEDKDDDKFADNKDGESSSKKRFKTTLADLLALNSVFERFVTIRKSGLESVATTSSQLQLPSTPPRAPTPNTLTTPPVNPNAPNAFFSSVGNTSCEILIQSLAAEAGIDYNALGLDLVDVDERESLQLYIEECEEWQSKAKEVLAEPECAALTIKLEKAKPLFHEPKLPPLAVNPAEAEASTTEATPPAALPIPLITDSNSTSSSEDAAITRVREILADFDDFEVYIPEIDQLSQITWSRDWLAQAQSLLLQCEYHMNPVKTEFGAEVPSKPAPVHIDALVSLLRQLRVQFGSNYTPFQFHMDVLRTTQRTRGSGKHEHDEEAEEEEEEPEEDNEPEADADEEEKEKEKEKEKEEQAREGKKSKKLLKEEKKSDEQKEEKHEELEEQKESAVKLEPMSVIVSGDGGVKMEVDEEVAAVNAKSEEGAAINGEADETGSQSEQQDASRSSSPSPLHPFLHTFQHDIQRLEYHLYELLQYAHRLRQLFERRLGPAHTQILLGPIREELYLWLAEASPAASDSGLATGTAGSGLLATCRRLHHLKGRNSARAPVSSTTVTAGATNATTPRAGERDRRRTHSPQPVSARNADDTSGKKIDGRRRYTKKSTLKSDDGDDNLTPQPVPAVNMPKKRGRKSKKELAAAAAAAAANAAGNAGSAAALPVALQAQSALPDSDDDENDNSLYCLCQRPYIEGEVMIGCDGCGGWFHTQCINLSKSDVKRVEELKFLCPDCSKKTRKVFRFRDKIPHRKAKARGPKLATVTNLLAKIPDYTTCEEIQSANAICEKAMEWMKLAEERINHPPQDGDTADGITYPELKQAAPVTAVAIPTADPAIAAAVNAVEPTVSAATIASVVPDVTMTDVTTTIVTSTPFDDAAAASATVTVQTSVTSTTTTSVEVPAEITSSVPMEDAAAILAMAAAAATPLPVSEPSAASAAVPARPAAAVVVAAPVRVTVESTLKAECAQRESVLKIRMAYTDTLSEALRAGMGIPLEFPGRKALEDRVRLLLNLEKAERIMIDNIVVPVQVAKMSEEKECDRLLAVQQITEPKDGKDKSDAPPGPPPPKEKEQMPVTPQAKKHEMKEIGVIHTELQRLNAAAYVEPIAAQNSVWPRFDAFEVKLQNWIDRTNHALYKVSSSLRQLIILQSEYKNNFLMVVCPNYADLSKRIHNVVKWVPKERKALKKRFHAAQLWKLQLDRVGDCGYSTSPYTVKIQAECTRCDEWKDRLQQAIDMKLGPSHFKALLKETEGETAVLVDPKDVKECEGFTQLYCLCQLPYQDGVFMIECSSCEDWFHDSCVKLPPEIVEAGGPSDEFLCPRCAHKRGVPYAYGAVDMSMLVPKAPSAQKTNPMPGAVLASAVAFNGAPVLNAEKVSKKRKKKDDPTGGLAVDPATGAVIGKKKKRKEEGVDDVERKAKKAKKASAEAAALAASTEAVNQALNEATIAAAAAGTVGPMSLAVLQHEPLMSVPSDAPPPRTAALYATLLYENLHVQCSAENSNVLWHLLNGYMNRMFDARLEEEILEAAKLVVGEALLSDALLHVNPLYTCQVQLQWRQQQQQQATLLAMQQKNAKAAADSDDDSGEEGDGKKRSKSNKARKPKNYPKPPATAYKLFVKHLRTTLAPGAEPGSNVTLMQNMQALADQQGKSVNKLMSEKWRQLGPQRAIFEEEYAAEKAKYDEAVALWNQQHGPLLPEGTVPVAAAAAGATEVSPAAAATPATAAVASKVSPTGDAHPPAAYVAATAPVKAQALPVVAHPHPHQPTMAQSAQYTTAAHPASPAAAMPAPAVATSTTTGAPLYPAQYAHNPAVQHYFMTQQREQQQQATQVPALPTTTAAAAPSPDHSLHQLPESELLNHAAHQSEMPSETHELNAMEDDNNANQLPASPLVPTNAGEEQDESLMMMDEPAQTEEEPARLADTPIGAAADETEALPAVESADHEMTDVPPSEQPEAQ